MPWSIRAVCVVISLEASNQPEPKVDCQAQPQSKGLDTEIVAGVRGTVPAKSAATISVS